MTRFPIALAAATLLCGSAAVAQMKPAAKPTAKPVAAAPKPKPAAASGGRMVSAKLANGKSVTYNCALAGNKTKKACQ